MSSETVSYRPIADYALIGDTHTAALVASDGSIDWCCLPHVDSPAVFCRVLDVRKGGYFRVGPAGPCSTSRRYLGDTNVLTTTYTTGSGQVRVTDLLAVEPRAEHPQGVEASPTHDVLRLVEGLAGEVEVEVLFRPTFDFARAETVLTPTQEGAVARAGHELLVLGCPVDLAPHPSGALVGRLRVAAGDRRWLTLAYHTGTEPPPALTADDAEAGLARTLAFWQRWSDRCAYQGPYHPLVRRSALTLKLLTFSPTGAIVAAPTTSLPEEIGGVRNWDYRFTWLRDSALILYALQGIGYYEEAQHFFDWLERLGVRRGDRLRIMYSVKGEDTLPECTLEHLEGYRGSRPVRIGNAAATQTQLDVYGEVLDAAHLHFARPDRGMQPGEWAMLRDLADRAARRWREADQGIWEVRGGPRHFLYSKLLCWVALDRAVRLAKARDLPADLEVWRRTRAEIRRVIETEGYDPTLGAFTQSLGESKLDASALAISLVGFLPPTDPRVQSTVERIRERLTNHGLVYRYLAHETSDGLPGGEATFALCSFWLVDNLALAGRVDEARALFERVAGYANDVGLMSEEIDPGSGALLGNHPQGFTHLALIRAALNIAKAEHFGAEEQAETQAERQPRAEAAGRAPRS